MAKMFYTESEAMTALGATSDEIREHVRGGRLREFRDGPRLMFKSDQVDALAAEHGLQPVDYDKTPCTLQDQPYMRYTASHTPSTLSEVTDLLDQSVITPESEKLIQEKCAALRAKLDEANVLVDELLHLGLYVDPGTINHATALHFVVRIRRELHY